MKRKVLLLLAGMTAFVFTTACNKDDKFNPENEKTEEVEINTNRKILNSEWLSSTRLDGSALPTSPNTCR